MMGGKISHTPGYLPQASSTTVADVEGVLAQWFGAEVVLTSSGRSAMLLYLGVTGHNRYRHRVALPRLISGCVLDVVIRRAFPVDAAVPQDHDTTFLYHQYGLPQLARSDGRVLEDICHAFFATPEDGTRDWAGEAAVFSLPKFFSTSTMIGGLVAPSRELARQLREARDREPQPSEARRKEHATVLAEHSGGIALETVYLERMLNPRILDSELGGAPQSVSQIRNVGARRRDIVTQLLRSLPKDLVPGDWRDWMPVRLPFALPVFGDADQMARCDRLLAAQGCTAGVYTIDTARDQRSPSYRGGLLLPCHDHVTSRSLEAMLAALSCLEVRAIVSTPGQVKQGKAPID